MTQFYYCLTTGLITIGIWICRMGRGGRNGGYIFIKFLQPWLGSSIFIFDSFSFKLMNGMSSLFL